MYAMFTPRFIIDLDLANWLSSPCFHQGRTDRNGGHRDWVNRTGNGYCVYHYHHGKPAHFHPGGLYPYGSKQTFIINPYTGKSIPLGQPYFMQYSEDRFLNIEYYSLNLVSKALTADDSMGLGLHNGSGGVFYACSTGDSTLSNLGEEFFFTYPKILMLPQDNTLFKTDNNKLELLCHTQRAALDDVHCYAYISMDSVRAYMTKNGYFTDLYNNGTGVWRFKRMVVEVKKPKVSIISPKTGEGFKVGDALVVKASIEDTDYAVLTIGGHTERRDDLNGQSQVEFDEYIFGDEDAGEVGVRVEVGNETGGDTANAVVGVLLEKPGAVYANTGTHLEILSNVCALNIKSINKNGRNRYEKPYFNNYPIVLRYVIVRLKCKCCYASSY